ncbi:MAG: toll/interleukin-1 receptor domain-containing protein [Anaerolineae bacterium]|nr:toll/interleukin-1 receptor domain-containing protein [Anaerolineae bacterium]
MTPSRQIFISYTPEDETFAARLANDLLQSGASVWLDILHAEPGRNWSRSVERALAESGMMIVILSPEALVSDHVAAEWQAYLEANRPVLPVIVEACEPPGPLRTRHPINFTYEKDYPRKFHELMTRLIERNTRIRRHDPVIWSLRDDVSKLR